jgi:hypothetical protein
MREGGMPDGDIVHVNLPRRYQKPYKQLCEGQYGDVELTRAVLRPLKRDLQEYGDAPLKLIQQVATELNQIPDEPLLKQSINWAEKSKIIDGWAQRISGPRIAIALAVKACQQQLQELRYSSCAQDLTKEIYRKYVSSVYEANFEGRVPLPQHYNGVAHAAVDARLQGMRAHVEQGIDSFAAQMLRNSNVSSLRCPPMARAPLGLHDDLLNLSK